jgi:protein-tyrosine-phosphatase
VLNKQAGDRFRASSAGVKPTASVDPMALAVLETAGYDVTPLAPKHFGAFAESGADTLDFVFTLSDTAAGERLPVWPGLPVTAHWGSADPTKSEGEDWERRAQYARLLGELERRIGIFINLPFAELDRKSLQVHVADIGSKT